MITSLTAARHNDVTVHRTLALGGTQADCIVALVNDKERLLNRLMELESIAPKKIKLPSGAVMVWHCPDEFIPLTQ